MRPVEKLKVGDAIDLFEDIADIPTEKHIVQDEYNPYGDARKVLLANLGNYCSYCEAHFENGAILQTEHVQPKGLKENGVLKYDHLKYKWSNFLLGCFTCNSKGNKGSKDVVLDAIHLPHLNNTFLSLIYKEAGVVLPNPALPPLSLKKAEALIDLIGLNKPSSETDYRCQARRQAWDKAQNCLKKYKDGKYKLDALIDYIKEVGHWSIWYTVFDGQNEVRKALLDFPGTASSCFDAENNYRPIYRHPELPDSV